MDIAMESLSTDNAFATRLMVSRSLNKFLEILYIKVKLNEQREGKDVQTKNIVIKNGSGFPIH